MLPDILGFIDDLIKWAKPLARMFKTHYAQFGYFFFFSIIRIFFVIFQRVTWRRNGLSKKLDRIWNGLDYERSAQILNVHWASKATPTDKVRWMQFVASHHEFTHPKYVLADDCMIAEVTPEYALFVQLKKSIVDYSVRTTTFLWAEMTYETRRIIIMPITSLQRLSLEVGKPKQDGANITFLWGSGRCGSTLIAKMVDAADPESLVLSEPPILMDLYSFKHRMRPGQFARFFELTTRLFFKPVTGKKKIFIKPIFFVLNVAEDMHAVLPKANMLYSYRKPLRTVWGHERAFGGTPFYTLLYLTLKSDQWEWGERLIGFHRYPKIDAVSRVELGGGLIDICTVIWADNLIRYREQAERFPFPAIIYDRLFDNPSQFCAEILSFAGADPARIDDALALLKGDSQEGSLFSQSTLKGLTITPFTADLKARADRFCDRLNLPRLELENGGNRPNQFTFPASSSSPLPTPSDASSSTSSTARRSSSHSLETYQFITEPSALPNEIANAGSGSGSTVNKVKKPARFEPYYKPLPMQIIFSKD